MKNPNGKIGIGIITHNRPDVFRATLKRIKNTLPAGAKLVVVDDASEVPCPDATYRFKKNVGIATAKNKCFELLDDCEHIFLFDDDCYPRRKGWEKPYIASPEPHLMYLFQHLRNQKLHDAKFVYEDSRHFALSHPRGCMLYFHRSVLDIAGGMDTRYAKWGNEHGDLSNRIYNLGLTSFRYMDVVGSSALMYSGDEEQAVETTVKGTLRHRYLVRTKERYQKSLTSTAYFPYKKGAKRKLPKVKATKAVVVCSFFNGYTDTQRGKTWAADYKMLDALRLSVNGHKRKLAITHNCFKGKKDSELVEHVYMPQGASPYFQRWLAVWQYLRANPDIKQVFAVDSTDVEMLHDPFKKMQPGVLYVGDEKQILGCQWMRKTVRHKDLSEFIAVHYRYTLLNCGVIGGSREDVMKLCRMMYDLLFTKYPNEITEMPVFNYILNEKWSGSEVSFGRHVTTVFKKNERDVPAWFKHK